MLIERKKKKRPNKKRKRRESPLSLQMREVGHPTSSPSIHYTPPPPIHFAPALSFVVPALPSRVIVRCPRVDVHRLSFVSHPPVRGRSTSLWGHGDVALLLSIRCNCRPFRVVVVVISTPISPCEQLLTGWVVVLCWSGRNRGQLLGSAVSRRHHQRNLE